jgi:hypothetical protein
MREKEAGVKKIMTPEKAKSVTLEVWEYLAEHPEIVCKKDLPKELFSKIKNLKRACPLCELFLIPNCSGCPLKQCSFGSPYDKWSRGITKAARKNNAQKIVEAVRAWELEKKSRAGNGRQRGRA